MEDTHVWVMDADGANRREVGRRDRQPAGRAGVVAGRRDAVYFTVQERGSVRALPAAALAGGDAEAVVPPRRAGHRRRRGRSPAATASPTRWRRAGVPGELYVRPLDRTTSRDRAS